MDKISSYPYFYVKDLVGQVAYAISTKLDDLLRILLSAMTLVIATMRSSLQPSISSVGGQFMAIIYKGRSALGHSPRGH
jgi:hypothetical protein